jgi:hypothetical protein
MGVHGGRVERVQSEVRLHDIQGPRRRAGVNENCRKPPIPEVRVESQGDLVLTYRSIGLAHPLVCPTKKNAGQRQIWIQPDSPARQFVAVLENIRIAELRNRRIGMGADVGMSQHGAYPGVVRIGLVRLCEITPGLVKVVRRPGVLERPQRLVASHQQIVRRP